MGTKRQKTAEGHHLSRVKAQRNRAIAPTSVLCQWPEYAEQGSHTRTAWSAKSFGAPFLPSGGSARISQPTLLPMREASIWRRYQSFFLKLYTNSSDTGFDGIFDAAPQGGLRDAFHDRARRSV